MVVVIVLVVVVVVVVVVAVVVVLVVVVVVVISVNIYGLDYIERFEADTYPAYGIYQLHSDESRNILIWV